MADAPDEKQPLVRQTSVPDIDDPSFLAQPFPENGRSGPPPSEGDVLGITTPVTGQNPILLLYRHAARAEEWPGHGNNSMAEAMALSEISAENVALSNPKVAIRSDHMSRINKQRAHRFLYSMGRAGMSKIEFGALVGMAAMVLGVIAILSIVYAPT